MSDGILFLADDGQTFHNTVKVRVANKDEAAGAADATAWMGRERSGVADVVWVIGKGDSCDPITKNDAGRTPASQLF
jgi:hypothetical protein